MRENSIIGLVPLLPIVGFVCLAFFQKSISKTLAAVIGCSTVFVSFGLSIFLFMSLRSGVDHGLHLHLFDWISVASWRFSFSFLVDPLSVLMMLIITGVGFLIHVYSVGYMHDDEGHNRFFAYLNLFIFFMLLLVMGSNYLILFIGWEGVGLSSYLLIGFWYKNMDYNKAATKAFIMNRIGDLGLILGILVILIQFGTLEYSEVLAQAELLPSGSTLVTTITLLLFIGAVGKSAQIPLHTWLPDAMAGPTPVSALIHAATMVTAGVYLVARNNILYTLAPFTTQIILIVGIATSLMAAMIALRQHDIKKILAYSTISQLGLMFVAHGVHAYASSMFHMLTHAFFKALLFLGAGSVIHAMQGEQDIRKMGGLKKHMPVTWITFFIGTLAIAGIPPLSGFFSKDEILVHSFQQHKIIWILASVSSFLTALYMFRLFFLTFWGDRVRTAVHPHESPSTMTTPLIILAALAAIAGLLGLPSALGGGHMLQHFLTPVFEKSEQVLSLHEPSHQQEYLLMAFAVALALIAIGLAYNLFVKKLNVSRLFDGPVNAFQKAMDHRFFIDELYAAAIVKPLYAVSSFFYKIIDHKVIDSTVNDFGFVVNESSKGLRFFQSGNIGYYILAMVIGTIGLLISSKLIFN